MTSRDFCYWLQGYFEVEGPKVIDSTKLEVIKKHLALVFEHELDPPMGPKEHQEKLNKIHSGGSPPPGTKFRC